MVLYRYRIVNGRIFPETREDAESLEDWECLFRSIEDAETCLEAYNDFKRRHA